MQCKISAEFFLRILDQILGKKTQGDLSLTVYSQFIMRFATNRYVYLFKGCFECRILSHEYFPNQNRIQENNVTECYLECQKENFTCRQNEPVYFALKVMLQNILLSVNVKF